MLSDTLLEKTGFRFPSGESHDDMLAPFRRRLVAARKFVFTREAVAMAANVAMSRPTSIAAALDWVRLKADPMWIEFTNADLRQAMADMGSPNVRPPSAVVEIVRSGFLIGSGPGGALAIEYAHADRTADGRTLADIAPVALAFDLSDRAPPEIGTAPKPSVAGIAGKVRRRFDLLASDPKEAAAEEALRDRFSHRPHSDLAPAARWIARTKGQPQLDAIEADQADEAWRLFCLAGLPGLILLNCRNAVDLAETAPSAKLNRTRLARGREPLQAYETVTMRLAPGARTSSVGIGTTAPRASALVVGHFKVRSSGVWWWSPHLRIGRGEPRPRTAVVKP